MKYFVVKSFHWKGFLIDIIKRSVSCGLRMDLVFHLRTENLHCLLLYKAESLSCVFFFLSFSPKCYQYKLDHFDMVGYGSV